MILSVWRFSHLFLACISVFFLIGASISGVILSFSSIEQENSKNQFGDLSTVSVSQLCDSLDLKYKETYSIQMKEGLAEVALLKNDGTAETIYINPINANQVVAPQKESRLFTLTRIFHRSLLLKKTGRILVGVSSLLLFFIAATGLALLIRRQGSFANVFRKISKDNFYTYWHAQLSRFFMIAIVLIALTGVYLSLERFEVLPGEQSVVHGSIKNDRDAFTTIKAAQVPTFKEIKLSELESLIFPFSPFPEDGDHYQIKTTESDLVVDQFTGKVVSTFDFGFQQKFRLWSYAVHTGKGSISWSVILCMACCSILFFIFSGLQISLKRLRHKKVNSFKIHKSEFIILVGSENGNTMRYARSIYDMLILNGKSVFLDYLNNFKEHDHKHHLLVLTSTYGLGEAPANASKFLKKLKKAHTTNPFDFSVLGFGSRSYPDFCQYAIDVDKALLNFPNATRSTELRLVNQQSKVDFESWKSLWCINNGLANTNSILEEEEQNYQDFEVSAISDPSLHPKLTFRLALKPRQVIQFVSGDLLAIRPKLGEQERLYSIGKGGDGDIILYIKRHHFGICSTFLSGLNSGRSIKAHVLPNKKFHVPKKFENLVMISNGTGIAPFIGMAHENKLKRNIHLFWGGKSQEDYRLYKKELSTLKDEGKITTIRTIFSEDKSRYVQELIAECPKLITQELQNGTSIMICGSIAMGQEVLAQIAVICKGNDLNEIGHYQENGQIKMDCY